MLRAPQDVARGELELVLRRNGRGRVLLAGEIVLHVVGREEERRVRVVVFAGATHDDDRVGIAPLGKVVPELLRVLPRDVRDSEAPLLRRDVEDELGVVRAELDDAVPHGLEAQLTKDACHDRDGVRLVDRAQNRRRAGGRTPAPDRGQGRHGSEREQCAPSEHRPKR